MLARGRILGSPAQLLGAAAACAMGFLAVLVVAYGSDRAARTDAIAFDDFGKALREPFTARAAEEVARLVDPAPFAVLVIALVIAAFIRFGVPHALAIAVLLAGANISTQLLKPILAEPRGTLGGWVFGPEAFPSGHSTAAMSLALAAVLVAPALFRPLVAFLGAGFALAVGFSLVAIDSHFPSDVAGGYLMAGAWTFAALAALRYWVPPTRPEPGRTRPVGVLLLAGLIIAAGLGAAQLPELVDHARGHTAFALVAAGTAALAAVLVAATALAASADAR